MDYKHWISKWQKENNFNIENDRNKPKSYIFSFFPKGNLHGFQNGDFRCLIQADIIARYKRQRGFNVLFPTGVDSLAYTAFIESKRLNQGLTDELSNSFYSQMLELGIGVNDSKYIDMRHNQYLELMQASVIELYKKGYIKYQNTQVYYDKKRNKIFDKRYNLDLPKINEDAFVLDIKDAMPYIVNSINSLPFDIKQKALDTINPKRIMELNFLLNNGESIEYKTEEPEYIGGISFILANPEYVDLSLYSSYDEIYSIEEYLDGKTTKFGVFSGLVATNPLTGEMIPVFISLLYDKPFYFGNPTIDGDDLALAKEEEIPYKSVLEKGVLVDSDFISFYSPQEARELIFNFFIEADVARESYEYASELLISSSDTFGALFPFLIDEDTKLLYSLEEHLPYAFSNKLRPVLKEEVDIVGTEIKGTMNSHFVNAMLLILSILYDSLGSQVSLLSDETIKEINKWTPIDFLAIKETDIENLVYAIAIQAIILSDKGLKEKKLFNNITIFNETLDEKNREIKKNNNNLLNITSILNSNYHDSLRLLVCDFKPSDNLIFYVDYLKEYNDLISKIISISNNLEEENSSLDFKLYQFKKAINDSLEKYDLNSYYSAIKDLILGLDSKIGKKQFKQILILLYPLIPFTAENRYQEIYNSKYSLINEDWPE